MEGQGKGQRAKGSRSAFSVVTSRAHSLAVVFIALTAMKLTACGSPRDWARAAGGRQRLSIATGGTGGVFYPYGGGIAKVISDYVPNVRATAEVTSASIDNLKFIWGGKADLALTLADTLDEAYRGTGAFSSIGIVPVRTLAVLYRNYTHIATWQGSGIHRLADLRGRVVSLGAAGSGTETIAVRILEAAGLDPDKDIQRRALGVGPSVDALKDGKLDAFVWSGGVPTGALLDLASTQGRSMELVAHDDVMPALEAQWGAGLYHVVPIPAGVYPGLNEPVNVIGVAIALVADARLNPDVAYEITKALFERIGAKAHLVEIGLAKRRLHRRHARAAVQRDLSALAVLVARRRAVADQLERPALGVIDERILGEREHVALDRG